MSNDKSAVGGQSLPVDDEMVSIQTALTGPNEPTPGFRELYEVLGERKYNSAVVDGDSNDNEFERLHGDHPYWELDYALRELLARNDAYNVEVPLNTQSGTKESRVHRVDDSREIREHWEKVALRACRAQEIRSYRDDYEWNNPALGRKITIPRHYVRRDELLEFLQGCEDAPLKEAYRHSVSTHSVTKEHASSSIPKEPTKPNIKLRTPDSVSYDCDGERGNVRLVLTFRKDGAKLPPVYISGEKQNLLMVLLLTKKEVLLGELANEIYPKDKNEDFSDKKVRKKLRDKYGSLVRALRDALYKQGISREIIRNPHPVSEYSLKTPFTALDGVMIKEESFREYPKATRI